jgi:purine nucleoside permease
MNYSGLCSHVSDIRTIAVINAFGKNEQVKKVFWTLFVAIAGLVLARDVDPVTAQQVVGMITGMGG